MSATASSLNVASGSSADPPTPLAGAGDSETLQQSYSKAAADIAGDIREAQRAFLKIYEELTKLKMDTKLRPNLLFWGNRQHSIIKDYCERWRTHYQDFQEILKHSRTVVGTARARVNDYLEFDVPFLEDKENSLQMKRDLMKHNVKQINPDHIAARNITGKIVVLHDEVGIFRAEIESLSTNKSSRLSRSTSELMNRALSTNQSPHITIEGILAAFDIQQTGTTLLTKLGAICNLWAAITAALLDIQERFGIMQTREEHALDPRIKSLHVQLTKLRNVLDDYEKRVIFEETQLN